MTLSKTRRDFIQTGLLASATLLTRSASYGMRKKEFPPTRVITRGPKHHWFGYYDKLQFDPTSRYVLGMEVDFQHRSPTGNDVITVGMVDLEDGDRWIPFGKSKAWNWQQGCMLQWRPGSKTEVLWNDRQGDRFVCHLYDIKTQKRRTIDHPIYSVSPDGKSAVAPDFSRPDGSRFIALHRWRYPDGSRLTRLVTAKPDGTDLRVVIPNGYASHFIWRDPQHILSQSRHYAGNTNWGNFLFQDQEGGQAKEVGAGILDGSGHLSYLPGNEWILNDTYPKGKERLQTPHLYHVKTKRRIDLGHFHLPAVYTGEWRVDTHPRFSPNSRYVCIDAPDGQAGRQLHLIDIQGLLD